ncbi:Dynein assembly factor with WDR repeat domains 1 [Dendrobium catenatum]|uniref:Dynein assembly factor with WDR repeat domains 1 n=1 Tax=Dendrobium catenatum TaxID=906689 RepID=A0A2I0XCT5_9ASPA|nr:Dynein assembly factor with WDR repeat domains 1 [Dendrobium catenatum]
MDDEDVEKALFAYLKKKGFWQTERALHEEQSRLSSAPQSETALSRSERGPALYHDGYSKLRSWAYGSLDLYKYSYNLLLQYLQKAQSFTMLEVINEHINFEVSSVQPVSISDDSDVIALVGNSQDLAKQVNRKEVRWGLLEDTVEERLEKTLSDSEKVEGENKDMDLDDNKKRSADVGKQVAASKKLKKDKVIGAVGKGVRSETSTVSLAPRVKPELTLPIMPSEVEQSILDDLRNRVQLSSLALPSVSFYTFINTHNGLNCASISSDGSLVAGGFSDSSLKVWDMSKIGQPAKTVSMQGENESSQNEIFLGSDEGKRSYTLFQGHSGPVYSSSFCPTGEFLLSSSADSTIGFLGTILWAYSFGSLKRLNANLVCYKGHNYPVWDIQCVQWHANCNYIATGSSDKTVRLWDVQTGESVRIFIGHRSMILSLAMSPDGRYMASGDEDGTIMMWDLSTGRCVSPLMGHNSCVWTLAFSGEGTVLASGSADGTVKLWDVTSSNKTTKMDDNKGSSGNRLRLLKAFPTKSTPVYTLQGVAQQRWDILVDSSFRTWRGYSLVSPPKCGKRRTLVYAVNQDAEKSFKKTLEVDRLIDTLRVSNPGELEQLVVENVLAFNEGFWIRLAARTETSSCKFKCHTLQKDYEELAASVMSIVDRLVHKANPDAPILLFYPQQIAVQQFLLHPVCCPQIPAAIKCCPAPREEKIESATDILKAILRPVVDGVREVSWPPQNPEALKLMEEEVHKREREGQLDEGFLAEVNAQLRQATEDGDKPGLAAMLRKVLQLYASKFLGKRSYAYKGGEVLKAEKFLESIIEAPEESWNKLLIEGLNLVSPEELYTVIKKRIERVLIRTEGGSYQQRILTEYLKGIQLRTEGLVQALKGSQQ